MNKKQKALLKEIKENGYKFSHEKKDGKHVYEDYYGNRILVDWDICEYEYIVNF